MAEFSKNIRRVNDSGHGAYTYYPILIVGGGEAGIAMGCRLKQVLGFDQFRIFERHSGIGGTWWLNRYPGNACDVPVVFYSFSFAPNYKWTKFNATGSEILDYLNQICEQYQIVDKIQCNTDVKQLRWLEEEQMWEATIQHLVPGLGELSAKERQKLSTNQGQRSVCITEEVVRAKIAIACCGALGEPNPGLENIPGRSQFEGEILHSSRWDASVSFEGKDVVVLGTGCSAAQIVPSLTKPPYNAKSVTQIMRSPPWVVPRLSAPGGDANWERWAPVVFPRFPLIALFFRTLIFTLGEVDFLLFFRTGRISRIARKPWEKTLLEYMRKTVPMKYHEILTPDYSFGCKRRVIDGGWFASLSESNVDLTTRPLTSIQPHGVTIGPGRTFPDPEDKQSHAPTHESKIPADVIVLANGFNTTNWLLPLKVVGKEGKDIHRVWEERGGPQAYMGNAMDGFPNFFIIFGPNTVTGHSSVILAIENMVMYSLKFVKKIVDGDVNTFEVKTEPEMAWTRDMQKEMKNTVFSGSCASWYKTASGWNATSYPRTQTDYILRCTFPRWSDWNIDYTKKGRLRLRLRRMINVTALIVAIFGAWYLRKGLAGRMTEWKNKILSYS